MKEKNVEAHLKVHLLSGKTITHNEAQKLWHTNRLAEYVRRLRSKGMVIDMVMVTKGDDQYGVYSIPKKKKVSKIESRAYMSNF